MTVLGIGVVIAAPASAEIVVSANDGKLKLVGGKTVVPVEPMPDTLTVIDLAGAARVVGEVRASASVIGPPSSVAVVRDESFAIVSAAAKVDPKDRSKTVPDSKVTLVNLRARPPKIVDVAEAGIGAAGVAISPAGHLVLVANRGEGTVSVFAIKGKHLKEAGKIALGDPRCGPSGIAITPDGKRALVTRDGDSAISILDIDREKVSKSGRDLYAGLKPYAVDAAAAYAAVANIGVGSGDADTVSLIDLKAEPPRVVDTLTVGQTPEGLKISPNGRFIAVTVMNGSNKETGSPFFNNHGLLAILAIENAKLVKIAAAPIGHWCQGVVWSRDGKRVLAGCMVEEEVVVFGFDGVALTFRGKLAMKAGPAALATAR